MAVICHINVGSRHHVPATMPGIAKTSTRSNYGMGHGHEVSQAKAAKACQPHDLTFVNLRLMTFRGVSWALAPIRFELGPRRVFLRDPQNFLIGSLNREICSDSEFVMARSSITVQVALCP